MVMYGQSPPLVEGLGEAKDVCGWRYFLKEIQVKWEDRETTTHGGGANESNRV